MAARRRSSIGRQLAIAVLAVVTAIAVWQVLGPDGEPSTDGSGAASPTPAPAEGPAPTEADPVRVLVAGDSLVGWIGPALTEALAGAPAEVIEDWEGSSGLARPDFVDWPARLAADMEAHDPEVVVMGFGGNDAQAIPDEAGPILLGTDEWAQEYRRRVAQALDAVEAPGRTVYWIGLPLTERDNIEAVAPVIAEAVAAEAATRPWVQLVDARSALAPDGSYEVFLTNDEGERVRVRADDGVHPSLDGGRVIVDEFVDDLVAQRRLDG